LQIVYELSIVNRINKYTHYFLHQFVKRQKTVSINKEKKSSTHRPQKLYGKKQYFLEQLSSSQRKACAWLISVPIARALLSLLKEKIQKHPLHNSYKKFVCRAAAVHRTNEETKDNVWKQNIHIKHYHIQCSSYKYIFQVTPHILLIDLNDCCDFSIIDPPKKHIEKYDTRFSSSSSYLKWLLHLLATYTIDCSRRLIIPL